MVITSIRYTEDLRRIRINKSVKLKNGKVQPVKRKLKSKGVRNESWKTSGWYR